MSSSDVFQKTSPRSLGWNTGRSSLSEPGCQGSHDYATVVIMFYSFCFNKVPSKTFRMACGDCCVDPAENQKLLHPVN